MQRIFALKGLIEAIKINELGSFAALVKKFEIKPKYYYRLVDYITQDSTIDHFVHGFDYEILLELSLLDEQLKKEDHAFFIGDIMEQLKKLR